MSHCQSSENLNYENPLELKSNSFSQSIHSTLIDNRINTSNFFKKNPFKKKRRRQANRILEIKINKIIKSQKIANQKLECIADILMSKFSNSNLYDLNHFEVNYIINKNEEDYNNYNSYNDSQNEDYDISQNKNKTEDLDTSYNKNKTEELEVSKEEENENDNLKYKISQNQSNYNNKFSNFEINLNKYHIEENKPIKKINYEEEENEENLNNEKEENKNEYQNEKIYNQYNNNENKVEKIKEEISEYDNININEEKNKDNDNINMSNYSEERSDINRKISLSQQSNYSEKSNFSKPLSSNMIKSSQDRFKKIRGFNFKIKNKKSFQQNEKKEISKIMNRPQHDNIIFELNNKENIKKNIEPKKMFNIEKEEKFDIITNDKIKDKKENE